MQRIENSQHFFILFSSLLGPCVAETGRRPRHVIDKGGVSENTVLPSGDSGYLEGPRKSFHSPLQSGAAPCGILPTSPPGAAGNAPRMYQTYVDEAGNLPLGIGRRIDLPLTQRGSGMSVPRYVEDDKSGNIDEAGKRIVFINEIKERRVLALHGFYFRKNKEDISNED